MKNLFNACFIAGMLTTGLSAQFCAFVPDATMTAGKTFSGNYSDHRSSVGIAYSLDCQAYYMVDIALAGTYNAPQVGNAITIGGGFDVGNVITEQACPSATESVAIYKRTEVLGSFSPWQLVKSQYAVGHWLPSPDIGSQPYCALSTSLRVTAPAGAPGLASLAVDHYRVMVLPKLFGQPSPARVSWSWSY